MAKFADRVEALKRLVKEKKEILVDDLISILQVSPNYAREVKKQVLLGGEIVEDQVRYLKEDGNFDHLGPKSLFEAEFHSKIVREQNERAKKQVVRPAPKEDDFDTRMRKLGIRI